MLSDDHNATVVGLQPEIAATPTDELCYHICLMAELPDPPHLLIWRRLQLSLLEVHRRFAEERRAAA